MLWRGDIGSSKRWRYTATISPGEFLCRSCSVSTSPRFGDGLTCSCGACRGRPTRPSTWRRISTEMMSVAGCCDAPSYATSASHLSSLSRASARRSRRDFPRSIISARPVSHPVKNFSFTHCLLRSWFATREPIVTRCPAVAERPRCRVR